MGKCEDEKMGVPESWEKATTNILTLCVPLCYPSRIFVVK